MLALLLILVATPADAQFQCTEPTTNEWLLQPATSIDGETVAASRVRPVVSDLPLAIEALKNQPIILLSAKEAARFAGPDAADKGARLKPYLVRAVFPSSRPRLDVRWSGKDLHISAAGLGCAPFTKHPVVIFLDRKPEKLFVTASAAL